MKALFDDRIIDKDEFSLTAGDRGFEYGDGFFETMLAIKGQVHLLPYHWQRIRTGLPVFGFRLPPWFTERSLAQRIQELVMANDAPEKARVKLRLWRKPGGRYTPEKYDIHILMTLDVIPETSQRVCNQVDLCLSIRNYPTPWSEWKTLSAMPYVLAGLEKRKRGLDDLIILDHRDHLSEMLFSNLFWIREGVFYTPSLDTGCVAGVMRSYLIGHLTGKGIQVKQVSEDVSALLQADYIISSNATGLIPVAGFQEREYPAYPNLQDLLP